jgi:hypothetical protein
MDRRILMKQNTYLLKEIFKNDILLKEDELGRACSTNGGEEECI